jgi:hypothetical protein
MSITPRRRKLERSQVAIRVLLKFQLFWTVKLGHSITSLKTRILRR